MRNIIKYILEEETRDQQIYSYMESYVTDILKDSDKRYLDGYIIIWDDTSVDVLHDGTLIEYDSYDGRLWISKKMQTRFLSFIPIDKNKLKEIIKTCFEKIFKVEVKFLRTEM